MSIRAWLTHRVVRVSSFRSKFVMATAKKSSIVTRARTRAAKRDGAKRKFRWRAGTVALREIKQYQKSTELLVGRNSFQRLVRHELSTMTRASRMPFRWAASAMAALQEASEHHVALLLAYANRLALHAGRCTLTGRDIQLAVASREVLA